MRRGSILLLGVRTDRFGLQVLAGLAVPNVRQEIVIRKVDVGLLRVIHLSDDLGGNDLAGRLQFVIKVVDEEMLQHRHGDGTDEGDHHRHQDYEDCYQPEGERPRSAGRLQPGGNFEGRLRSVPGGR